MDQMDLPDNKDSISPLSIGNPYFRGIAGGSACGAKGKNNPIGWLEFPGSV